MRLGPLCCCHPLPGPYPPTLSVMPAQFIVIKYSYESTKQVMMNPGTNESYVSTIAKNLSMSGTQSPDGVYQMPLYLVML